MNQYYWWCSCYLSLLLLLIAVTVLLPFCSVAVAATLLILFPILLLLVFLQDDFSIRPKISLVSGSDSFAQWLINFSSILRKRHSQTWQFLFFCLSSSHPQTNDTSKLSLFVSSFSSSKPPFPPPRQSPAVCCSRKSFGKRVGGRGGFIGDGGFLLGASQSFLAKVFSCLFFLEI